MNLRESALARGIRPQTGYRWDWQGKLPVLAQKMGKLVLVGDLEAPARRVRARSVLYARVHFGDQRAELDQQEAGVVAWATQDGQRVDDVVTEVSSSLDGRRPKFLTLLRDGTATTVVVEHQDRVLRVGAEHLEAALEAQGRRIVVVDASEVRDDLVRDDLWMPVHGGAWQRAAS